ncbi:MAG: hypothetical protein IKL70_02860 [Oscillospiraceae bacterium]|nr:hypothetical protein [Oscillospiraceae bacterium]
MPFINVKTNREVSDEKVNIIKTELGKAITAIPGKSEMWLMVCVEGDKKLFFRGENVPAAMVEVSVYGNASQSALSDLTARITGILTETLSLSPDCVYVSYTMMDTWGWNGSNL